MTTECTTGPLHGKRTAVYNTIVDQDERLVAFISMTDPAKENGNFRRLIACWNACQEISTEAIEAGDKPACKSFADLYNKVELDRLRAINAELLQELKNISTAKRFDRNFFEDDHQFAAWAQSRAAFTLGKATS